MKKLLLLCFLIFSAFALQAQDGQNAYKGRRFLTVPYDNLIQAKTLGEISPELWHRMVLHYSERDRIDKMLHMQHSLYFSLVSAQKNDVVFPNSAYEKLVDYVSFEITVQSKGKLQTLAATGDKLTSAQQLLLKNADLGSPILLKLKYYHLKEGQQLGQVHESELHFEPIPFQPAAFPGGYQAITDYLQSKVLDKITTPIKPYKPFYAGVKFTIDEQGKVIQISITDASRYPEIDELLLKALKQMPNWRPALDSKNLPVKESFSFSYPFMDGC